MVPIGFESVTTKINSVQGQNRSVFLELPALALAVRSHFFWRLCNKEWLTIDIKVCRKLLISCLHHRILHYVEIEDWQLVQSTTPCCCCLLLPMWIGLGHTNLWKIFDHRVKRWINSIDGLIVNLLQTSFHKFLVWIKTKNLEEKDGQRQLLYYVSLIRACNKVLYQLVYIGKKFVFLKKNLGI
mgnify:CR=1 FL=1